MLAFANSQGGTVYFGIEDDGEVTGCSGNYDLQNMLEYNARIDMKQPIIIVLDRLTEKIQNDNKIQNVQIEDLLKDI